jgi:hypothetical protein
MDDSALTSLPGRVAKIVRWLIENYQRVMVMQRGRLTFNFSGDSVSVELNEVVQIP